MATQWKCLLASDNILQQSINEAGEQQDETTKNCKYVV